jgi:DNA-binding NarL/FixJ family response regulator
MTPFIPLNNELHWDHRQGIEASRGYVVIFGTASPYEAYLFISLYKVLGAEHVLGAGCTEKEVEDLVDASRGPILLFLVDGFSKDCGVGLVNRLKEKKPELKAMLLINSLEAYAKNLDTRKVFNGIAAGGDVGRGGLLRCLEAVIRGERYLDPLLKEVNTECERFDWNELNQREREILPLLARGFKNKDIAAELFIAETTARDYVSSILSKLQVSNRAAAAAWAIKNGLIGG